MEPEGTLFMGARESDGNDTGPERSLNAPHSEPASNLPQQGGGKSPSSQDSQTAEEALDERRKIRRLQMMMDMVMSVIGQDEKLTVDEAAELIADSKKAALAMFPDKELAYNLIYKPRLQRLMRERYRIQ
jgi:hypothetical protein